MKYILFLLLLPSTVRAQQNNAIILRDTFISTLADVKVKMAKYNKSHQGDFWKLNIVEKPIYENADTIIYSTKFLTNYDGMLLWGSKCMFYQNDDRIICEVSQLTQLKKSSMASGVQYLNVKVDEMERTKGNEFNLKRIKKEVNNFFKFFK